MPDLRQFDEDGTPPMTISPIELPVLGLEQMRVEALQEGFLFVERLCEEWDKGNNRFNEPGEKLFGCMDNAELVGIGGLNRDPFESRSEIGRIRRVYVRPAWRNKRVGQTLVHTLIEYARTNFTELHLRTDNPTAARLYERVGFSRRPTLSATHVLYLESTTPSNMR